MKEKIKEHIKKHKIIYSALLLLFCFSGVILSFNKLGVSDELFTFANVYKLHNGVQLYSQNNIIDTPLFFYLANAFLSVVGMNFFAYKLFAIILFEIIFLLILNILRKLKVLTLRAIVYISLMILHFVKTLYANGANYNVLALLFWLLGMYLIIKKDKLEVKAIQQGIVAALVFATKQNIGIYYLIGLSLFTIYNYRKEIKTIIKKLFSTYVVFLLATAIWVVALAIQGQFKDFINYCFLGLGEFAKNNASISWTYLFYYLIPFLTIIGLIIAKRKFQLTLENEIINVSIFFLCFMLPSLLIGYPIFNVYHIELASLISVVYCTYLVEQLVSRMIEIFNIKIIKYILVGYFVIFIAINIYYICSFVGIILNKNYTTTYDNPYFGMNSSTELNDKMSQVLNFIKLKEENNQKVVIFSTEANLYQIALKQNNQDFDLPFLGNWGYQGEERVLNKIKNLKDTFILINDEDLLEQESSKIKDSIKSNYNKTGEIADFDIYYIK